MKCYHVDAFSKDIFKGNPAIVCVLNQWLRDDVMQKIAIEHNLSETAFVVPEGKDYGLRWFTPGGEIDLCGHATLAAAYVLKRFVKPEEHSFLFHTMKNDLVVTCHKDLFSMEFPAYDIHPVAVTPTMTEAIGIQPIAAYMGRDLVCVLPNETDVRNAVPNQQLIRQLDGLLFHITAKGQQYDCVSRSFGPKLDVPEDPVCGSGHCHIVPLWADLLRKKKIHAYQASKRGGELYCELQGNTVILSGYACLYSKNEVQVINQEI